MSVPGGKGAGIGHSAPPNLHAAADDIGLLSGFVLFEFLGVDLLFHIIEETGPGVGLEGGDEFPGVAGAAFRAGQIVRRLPHLTEGLEFVSAFSTFKIVQGHYITS